MFSPSDIEDAELRELYEYWRSKHRSNRLAARTDIDPIEIPGLLKHIAILEVVGEAEDFVFALAGSRIEDVHERSLKGVSLRQLRDAFEVAPGMDEYVEAVRSREPQYQDASLTVFGKVHWACRCLILPLSSNGESVEALLLGAVFRAIEDPGQADWPGD